LRNVLESVPDCLFSLNPTGDVLYVSPGSVKVFGYTPQEFSGNQMVWLERGTTEDLPQVLAARDLALGTGLPQTVEYRSQRQNGQPSRIQTRYIPAIDPDGRVVRLDG